ncbi:AQG_2a_G0036200.mRNA.1.CDS.1 [Saccharomyces cerevisiae]|uniref:Regulator of free ubiquitin chains 1 n=9 Tax=Saccharomyces TaxID=4930 RepID=RFU1_YEAST|nr:Rfu1p [Saccharomyces cerevisiae S288C]A7A0X8.1 RecName: Full=Regulator of free ubiquitin chains 1 [Saccharomyces cerevisiae YJM789]B3LT42.1 RecName: Full=Regulator of free ubiquitin chains 1 [Saccharomyces cerevisiae RM11-1a]Q08003.1 RecName: Full=Regulator of free ubiquitin chains 1 [Saccharomyces cerevisiae S288C]AAS56858.1 YLR073C [Saccharomyces cerevisiae]AHY78476.1 Rfu1p [Saccharomyces cerevisiae YJM993]AJP40255.1 Rfu1p [Saccharomyces cerevisiae YJM1078]AJV46157.1 Rfu1p [Saccharomyce|eukprot:NP_013174.1 Rfu1p [Saccharomyces cerevisiae S288C]
MKSSKQLVQDAKDYRFNPAIPLRIYLKTCIGILEKAQCAFQANDLSLSFIYYFRYVDLLTNKLSRHPELLRMDASSSSSSSYIHKREYLQLIKLEVPAVCKIIESLRTQIDSQYSKLQTSLANNIAKPNINANTTPVQVEQQPLPKKSFDEYSFNQSISFFQKISNAQLNTGASSQSQATARDEAYRLNYPELPRLTFST